MKCEAFINILGNRIKTIRESQKISQAQLAKLSGLHSVYISNIETGQRRASICTYLSIANALNISLSELVQLPGDGDYWNSNMVELFQLAKKLDGNKQKLFVDAAKGMLKGLEG